MPLEKATAIVIRSVEFSETSRVVTLFTREFGKLGALAKGAKRLRGPFSGGLDLLSVCRIVLIRKHSDSLDLLTDAEQMNRFSPQRNSLHVLNAGYYVAELLLELSHDYDPHPALFDAAVETLRELESGGSAWLVVRRFELTTLRETGHMPQIEACAGCGAALPIERVAGFSAMAGGLVCVACRPTVRATMRLETGSVRVLQTLAEPAGDAWRSLQVQPAVQREVAAVTAASITHLTGKSLRTAQFLGSLPS